MNELSFQQQNIISCILIYYAFWIILYISINGNDFSRNWLSLPSEIIIQAWTGNPPLNTNKNTNLISNSTCYGRINNILSWRYWFQLLRGVGVICYLPSSYPNQSLSLSSIRSPSLRRETPVMPRRTLLVTRDWILMRDYGKYF